jgi:hypothetical protein
VLTNSCGVSRRLSNAIGIRAFLRAIFPDGLECTLRGRCSTSSGESLGNCREAQTAQAISTATTERSFPDRGDFGGLGQMTPGLFFGVSAGVWTGRKREGRYRNGGQKGQIGQNDPQKEQQTASTVSQQLCLFESLDRRRNSSISGLSRCMGRKQLLGWVGWGSNPQPTP